MSNVERCDICNKLLVSWFGVDSIYHENYFTLNYNRIDETIGRVGVFCSVECLKKHLGDA